MTRIQSALTVNKKTHDRQTKKYVAGAWYKLRTVDAVEMPE